MPTADRCDHCGLSQSEGCSCLRTGYPAARRVWALICLLAFAELAATGALLRACS